MTTEDRWQLNVFRLRPLKIHYEYYWSNGKSVLMVPDSGMDAETMLQGYFVGSPLPLKLAATGYTVYMANNRGTKYSSVNLDVADMASEQYWDFDFTDMGVYDLPAIIHSIKQFDGQSLRMIAYGKGNMQMFYGLTQLEDFYYSGNISSYVAMAPCVLPVDDAKNFPNTYAEGVGAFRDLGVYAINGPNWEQDLSRICANLNQNACFEA